MRTGAIFARGSCRALQWMLVLGALSVLGSSQATAQAVDKAQYPSTTSRNVEITMSGEVWVDLAVGENAQSLSGDFALVGGNTGTTALADAAAVHPIAVDGIPSDRYPGTIEFTLRFAQVIGDLTKPTAAVTTPTQLRLVYTAVPGRQIKGTVNDTAITIASPGAPVISPTQTSDLRLTLTRIKTNELETPMMRGKTLAPAPTAAQLPVLKLPAATGPVGATLTYSVINLPPGLASTTDAGASPPAGLTASTNASGTIYGTLPAYIGTWDVIYSVTDGTNTENVMFKINVADTPEAVTGLAVVAAGPSSLKVTWAVPVTNNSSIISYHLDYRADGTTDWLPALLPESIVASRSYTIEGLAPGDYEVRVRGSNNLGPSGIWAMAKGSTGAGPGKPVLAVAVDSTIPEDRDRIPVTVTATVPPSATSPRTFVVTLALKVAGTAEERAEVPNTAGIAPDVNWDGASATATTTTLSFTFDSNLSSEKTAYLNTHADDDAEPESFKIEATTKAVSGVFSAAAKVTKTVMIDDDEEQEYELRLDDVALESSGMFDEGHGDEPVKMTLMVSPARTLPKSFFVNLESAQDARDYSLSSGGTSSGGPTAVSLRIDMAAGQGSEPITLTAASNDGDRVDDTITLQMFETAAASPTTAGGMVGDAVMLKVVDQHKLPMVTMGSIVVDGAAVTSLKEGETGTVTLMADRGTPTDDVPDGEKVTVALTHGAASSASEADYSLSSDMVAISGTSGTFILEVLADDEIDAEELVLMAKVMGEAMYGPPTDDDSVSLGPISLMDGTTKLVYPKTEEEIQAVIYPAKEAGMGDDMMFNPGETIEIATPGALFNHAEGVTLSFTAESDMDDVATVTVSGSGMVTVTGQDMAGVMAHITITAHASTASGAKPLPQTDPSEASVIFPVEVGLEALSFTLTGPEDMMNLAEGKSAMVTATANRAVTEDVTINLMRDRAASTAGDDDYMAEAITIEAGMMSGTTMVMAAEDNMAEEMEELTLYGMAADNAGEVTGQVKLYLWDAAVPALPLIAQLLLGLFLAIGGFRRYLRR